jgi:hypothetical protein
VPVVQYNTKRQDFGAGHNLTWGSSAMKYKVLPWLVLLALVALCGFVPVERQTDDGMREVPFHFLTFDAETKHPLPGVAVQVERPYGTPELRGGTWETLTTDADGKAALVLPCMCGGMIHTVLLFRSDHHTIYYPQSTLITSKAGYLTRVLYLPDLTGWGRAGSSLPPTEVVIELDRGKVPGN